MKKILLILSLLFLMGVVVADVCTKHLFQTDILLTLDVLKNYAYADIIFHDVIWNLFYERLKLYLFLSLCRMIAPIRNYINIILLAILAFCFGFFTMTCILAIGFVGVLISCASILPHGILYFASYQATANNTSYSYQNAQMKLGKLPRRVLSLIFAVLFFVTACILECVMSVHFIPWIIRLSLI